MIERIKKVIGIVARGRVTNRLFSRACADSDGNFGLCSVSGGRSLVLP